MKQYSKLEKLEEDFLRTQCDIKALEAVEDEDCTEELAELYKEAAEIEKEIELLKGKKGDSDK